MRDLFNDRDRVIPVVCEVLGDVTPVVVMGKSRKANAVFARQLVMWVMNQVLGYSSTQVGLAMGRNHATVLHSIGTVRDMSTKTVRDFYHRENKARETLEIRFGEKVLENRIIELLRDARGEFEGESYTKHVEVDYGNVKGTAYAAMSWHSEEDVQTFDWGQSVVQTERVVDGIKELEVEGWDADTEEDIKVDTDYISRHL